MQPYDTLTPRGKAARLRQLAWQALSQYDLPITRLSFVGFYTNTLFRALAADGRSYLLRLCAPGWRTDEDRRSEVLWLQYLSSQTDIGAPAPVLARGGAFWVDASVPGVPQPRRCMLMTWLPGVSLEKRLTEANLEKMGQLFARLHQSSLNFQPPPGFTTRRMNSLFARGEDDILFTNSCTDAFTPANRELFTRLRAQVDQVYHNRYADPAGLRVIHHDLFHGNIKVNHGRLHPLDFEDTVWGYPVQDIAMAMQDLMTDTRPEVFETLLAAFRKGYESRCPWPERCPGEMDTFRAGRMLWVTNYVARFERPYLKGHIEWIAGPLQRFLESGRLRLG